MKAQPTTPQVLQHLLLVQHGTIRSHQHVVARVKPFESSVVLLLQCAIENVRMDARYLLCRHAISSQTLFATVALGFKLRRRSARPLRRTLQKTGSASRARNPGRGSTGHPADAAEGCRN